MADNEPKNGEGTPEEERQDEGDLGNLPPLSDFESSQGFDSNLPPLGNLDSDQGGDEEETTGLPPISDIPVETPAPTGGNVRPSPPGFEGTSAFDTPASGSDFDSPAETPAGGGEQQEAEGFGEFGGDSDFTPETPEVAPPGPDSDMETPMFDSAFGGASDFSGAADTSAPTQQMQTPMFGQDAEGGGEEPGFGDDFGFDQDAFEGDQGTPSPSFEPDTGAQQAPATAGPVPAGPPGTPRPTQQKGGGMGSVLVGGGALVIGLIIGVAVGPRLPIGFLNPAQAEVDQLEVQIQSKDQTIAGLRQELAAAEGRDETVDISPEQLENLRSRIDEATTQLNDVEGRLASNQAKLDTVEDQLETSRAEYAELEGALEDLNNQYAIVEARESGLQSEVQRLENLVGELEQANARRSLTKETLASNIEELEILIREGNALVPAEYDRMTRLEQVQELKARAAEAKWVDPALLTDYTEFYINELTIAGTREHFFAKIPVIDRFGTRSISWAECLMNGNWGTYYRTLDGEHTGLYQNVTLGPSAKFRFVEKELSDDAREQIAAEIASCRPPEYQEQRQMLLRKEKMFEDKPEYQRVFDSL